MLENNRERSTFTILLLSSELGHNNNSPARRRRRYVRAVVGRAGCCRPEDRWVAAVLVLGVASTPACSGTRWMGGCYQRLLGSWAPASVESSACRLHDSWRMCASRAAPAILPAVLTATKQSVVAGRQLQPPKGRLHPHGAPTRHEKQGDRCTLLHNPTLVLQPPSLGGGPNRLGTGNRPVGFSPGALHLACKQPA